MKVKIYRKTSEVTMSYCFDINHDEFIDIILLDSPLIGGLLHKLLSIKKVQKSLDNEFKVLEGLILSDDTIDMIAEELQIDLDKAVK